MFKKILAGLLLVGVAGCSSNQAETAIRAVVLSPDSPNLDVSVDENVLLTNAPFTSASGHVRFNPGTMTMRARQTGTSPILEQTTALFLGGKKSTYVVVGPAGSLNGVVLDDAVIRPPINQAQFRIFHAAQPLGNLDFYITLPGVALATQTPVATSVAFTGFTAYIVKSTGTWQVRATTAGTLTEVFTSANITVATGDIRSTFLVENAGGGAPYSLLVLND